MADAQGPTGRGYARAERSAKTLEALAAAAATPDPERRRRLLVEAAELNLWVVDAVVASMAPRYCYTDLDPRRMAACAQRAYTHAVLSLEPAPDLDLLTRVVPAVRDAVRHCARTRVDAESPDRPP